MTVPAAGDLPVMGVRATPHTPNPGAAYALPVSDNLMGLCLKLEDGENVTGVVREGEFFRIRSHEDGPALALSAAYDAETEVVAVQVFEVLTTEMGHEVLRHVEGLRTSAEAAARLDVRGTTTEVRAFRVQPAQEGAEKSGTC